VSILVSSAALRTVPDIIKAASSSPLGILALLVLVLGALAYAFFKNASMKIRVGIFSALLLGAALYTAAILRAALPGKSEDPRQLEIPAPLISIDGVIADTNSGASIALATITTALSPSPAITDSNGIFHLEIKSSDAGDAIVLHVSKDGYESLDWTVTPPLKGGIRILLKKGPSGIGESRPGRHGSPDHDQRIDRLALEVRATCTLRDPSQIPQVTDGLLTNDKTSYLEGPRGRFYLESNPHVPFRRAEEEGQVYAIQTFALAEDSNLIGSPISRVAEFTKVHIDEWSISGNQFKFCTHVEVVMLMNGRQVYSRVDSINVPVLESKVLSATIPIAAGNIKLGTDGK
jgi:hypothetical protein